MLDFIDLSVIQDLADWQLDRAYDTCIERLEYARQDFYDLTSWEALQEDLDDCQARLEELAVCKGKIRAEIVRRHPYRANFT